MHDATTQTQSRISGEVRIRSNVCLSQDDWRFVPGDAIRSYGLDRQDLTAEQQEERMRYEPCCLCRRTIYEIREFGCDNYTCRRQRLPSVAEAARRREEHLRLEEARQQLD